MVKEDSWNCHCHLVLLEKEELLHLSTKILGQRRHMGVNSTLLLQPTTKAASQHSCVPMNSGGPGSLQMMNNTDLWRGSPAAGTHTHLRERQWPQLSLMSQALCRELHLNPLMAAYNSPVNYMLFPVHK